MYFRILCYTTLFHTLTCSYTSRHPNLLTGQPWSRICSILEIYIKTLKSYYCFEYTPCLGIIGTSAWNFRIPWSSCVCCRISLVCEKNSVSSYSSSIPRIHEHMPTPTRPGLRGIPYCCAWRTRSQQWQTSCLLQLFWPRTRPFHCEIASVPGPGPRISDERLSRNCLCNRKEDCSLTS